MKGKAWRQTDLRFWFWGPWHLSPGELEGEKGRKRQRERQKKKSCLLPWMPPGDFTGCMASPRSHVMNCSSTSSSRILSTSRSSSSIHRQQESFSCCTKTNGQSLQVSGVSGKQHQCSSGVTVETSVSLRKRQAAFYRVCASFIFIFPGTTFQHFLTHRHTYTNTA